MLDVFSFRRDNISNSCNISSGCSLTFTAITLGSPKQFTRYTDPLAPFPTREIVSTEKSFIIFEILDEVNGFIKENGFYDSYQLNFLNFKISHLKYRLNEVANHCKEKLYSLIRTEFNNIDVSSDNLKELSFDCLPVLFQDKPYHTKFY